MTTNKLLNEDRSIGDDMEAFVRKEFYKRFGRRLNDALCERCMTQSELAKRIRISKSTVSLYCKGESIPTIYGLFKIAVALDKTIDDFF